MSGPLRLQLHTDIQRNEAVVAPRGERAAAQTRTPLLGEDTPLLMHAKASQGLKPGLIQWCAAAQLGAIYTRPKRRDLTKLIELHRTHDAGPVLFDAERYSGKDRDQAKPTLDPDWIVCQRSHGLPYGLTDSPIIEANDLARLKIILEQGARIPGAITALPLAKRWFTHDVNEVVQQINRFSTPVALMAEDRDDPFASTKAISGLIRLLDDARVPVLLLRCDVTAIGTLAFGASHAAIGTTTGLRHIWPPTDKGGFRLPAIAAFVPKAMSYRTLPNIGYAVLHYPDDQVRWRCDCDVCAGSTLDHLADEDEAAMHSLLCLSDLTQAVLQDPSLAAQAWIERCRHALSINQEVAAALVKNWPTPGNLDAWVSAVG